VDREPASVDVSRATRETARPIAMLNVQPATISGPCCHSFRYCIETESADSLHLARKVIGGMTTRKSAFKYRIAAGGRQGARPAGAGLMTATVIQFPKPAALKAKDIPGTPKRTRTWPISLEFVERPRLGDAAGRKHHKAYRRGKGYAREVISRRRLGRLVVRACRLFVGRVIKRRLWPPGGQWQALPSAFTGPAWIYD